MLGRWYSIRPKICPARGFTPLSRRKSDPPGTMISHLFPPPGFRRRRSGSRFWTSRAESGWRFNPASIDQWRSDAERNCGHAGAAGLKAGGPNSRRVPPATQPNRPRRHRVVSWPTNNNRGAGAKNGFVKRETSASVKKRQLVRR
jgi:hypothetical protein